MRTATVADVRHEMDATATSKRKATGDVKTKFVIRTLPRERNPTPVPTGTLSASASGLLSPLNGKVGGRLEAEREILQQEDPFDDITEDKLRQLTGSQELARVTSLQISVDSTKQSVEVIGELLPTLQQLRLQQSTLSSFRDLGTSLGSLRILWAMHCQISDLDGIGALVNLQELYLQHNNVSDISPLTMHEELRVIDLEGNRVADIGQLEQLVFCPQLTSLNLVGNPVETDQQYRQIVANFVPQLVTLDDKAFSDSERGKLSDVEIDAAILKHREVSDAKSGVNSMPFGGINPQTNSFSQLSYSSSTASLNGSQAESPRSNDSGSRLTHGTDIVFAGNVSSALRRRRYEAEAISDSSELFGRSVGSRPPSSHGMLDRPKTPAQRVSITDTLDRARELDTHKHKSRDAILDELKIWQLDSVGTSQVGVPRDTNEELYTELDSVPTRSRSRRKGSIDGISGREAAATRARLEPRPNTSAGVMRNGANVREAFVEMSNGKDNGLPRPSSRGGASKQRSSASSTSGVDILILDGGDEYKRPCSPMKSSRGIFSTNPTCKNALGRNHEYNLEVLSPKVDITTAKRHLPSSLTSKQQLERSLASREKHSGKTKGDDTDSDSEDESSASPAVATGFSSPMLVPKTAFFNVAESLNAIEKWRDEMEYDAEDTDILSVACLQQSCLSPRSTAEPVKELTSMNVPDQSQSASGNQQRSPTRQDLKLVLGPGNNESDRQLVQLLKEKNGQLKTRDGFRSYFRGIDEGRLASILGQAFADSDKVRRRMQLMSGFFRHELQR